MIMIDVLVPPLDEAFDVETDESVFLEEFVFKLKRIIESIRNVSFGRRDSMLFSINKAEFVKNDQSFKAQGITNGERMVLV
ncbi:MAG: hypothetical protein K6A38_09710 [Lachnospiraceae bacterium]|nr:hypothetical protein [Lachnospiraceae bacterium]